MRRFTLLIIVILAALIGLTQPVVRAQNARDAEAALKAAEQQADVQGDLKGAIAAYQKLVGNHDKAIAAKALLGMAECHQKLGDAQAAKIYQQLIRDYGGQPEAGEARSRLAALAEPSAAGHRDSVVWASDKTPSAISSDGRWAAFVDDSGSLFLHDLRSGTDRQVAQRGNTCADGADGDVAFSRDGAQLVFTCFIGASKVPTHKPLEELWIVNVGGAPTAVPRKLLSAEDLEGGWQPNWTADGRAIVIALDRRSSAALGPYDTRQIAVVSASDGSVRVLKTARLVDDISVEDVSLSSDDRWVAFDFSSPSGVGVSILPMSGGQEVAVLTGQSDARVVGWSPDATRLLFTSTRSGSSALYAQRITDGKPNGTAEQLVPNLGPINALGISPAGSLYYIPEPLYLSDVQVGAVDFASGRIVSPPASVSWSETDSSGAPDFSADGSLLGFATSSPGWRAFAGRRVVFQTLDPAARQELPVHLRVNGLVWAPDGKSLAMTGVASYEKSGLWKIDRATGNLTPIALRDRTTQVGFYRWSADSRTVYFDRFNPTMKDLAVSAWDAVTHEERVLFHAVQDAVGGPDVHFSHDEKTAYYRRMTGSAGDQPFAESVFVARDLPTGAEREFARGSLGGVALSPDGRYVATGKNDEVTHSRSIALIPVDGGPARDLIRVDLPSNLPKGHSLTVNPLAVYAWAPDGRSLIAQKSFGTARVERQELWWVPVEGSAPPVRLDIGPYSDLRISPDNRHIAFTVPPQPGPRTSEVHVLEHFLPAIK